MSILGDQHYYSKFKEGNPEWKFAWDFLYGPVFIKEDKRIIVRQALSLLNLTDEELVNSDLNLTYEKLQIAIEEYRKKNPPREFKLEKISIPKVYREYPKL